MADTPKGNKKKRKGERKQKFIAFLKRNMTWTWFKHISYQIFAFLVSVSMIVGVAIYAFNKNYSEKTLIFMDDFTITAHTGAFDTPDNSMEALETAISKNVQIFEVDVRMRPNGTVVMGHDLITTNTDGVELSTVFSRVKETDLLLNLDIKEVRVLAPLSDLIRENNLNDRVFLTGIETFQVKKVKEDCPDIAYYLNCKPSRIKIFSEDYQQNLIGLLEETGAVGINCNHIYASRTLSNMLHDNGYKLSIWTVDRSYQMKRALINKPDNITTHYPDKLNELIVNWGK